MFSTLVSTSNTRTNPVITSICAYLHNIYHFFVPEPCPQPCSLSFGDPRFRGVALHFHPSSIQFRRISALLPACSSCTRCCTTIQHTQQCHQIQRKSIYFPSHHLTHIPDPGDPRFRGVTLHFHPSSIQFRRMSALLPAQPSCA